MTQIILEIGQPVVIEKLRSLAQKYQRTLEEQIVLILENAVMPLPQEQRIFSALDNDQDGFWDMTLRFRQRIQQENIVFADEDFAGLRDGQIASIAYINNLVLVTNNVSDFQFFDGLKIENWFVNKEDKEL
jgi:predicted nucleic acid-binding protein